MDEIRMAAVVCTVSFREDDRAAVAAGGWVHAALHSDATLREFVRSRLDADGVFHPDQVVVDVISRIMSKTALGLLFYEFGRLVKMEDIRLVAVDHVMNRKPLALVEQFRCDDSGWEEVTSSGRQLERQVIAMFGGEPPHSASWRVYVPQYFEYVFIRRSNDKLLTAMKLHDAMTVLVECPWPTAAGPRRKGKPRPRRR